MELDTAALRNGRTIVAVMVLSSGIACRLFDHTAACSRWSGERIVLLAVSTVATSTDVFGRPPRAQMG